MFARVTLNSTSQDREEPVRKFGAKLRGQGCVCKFILKCNNCNHEVNCTDRILRGVLVRMLISSQHESGKS